MTPETILPLVRGAGIRNVLIIDDAYDDVPLSSELDARDTTGVSRSLSLCPPTVRRRLDAVLDAEGFDKDDYANALQSDAFAALLYQLYKEGKLAKKTYGSLFQAFEGDRAQKRRQLAELEGMLENSLGLCVVRQGRTPRPIDAQVQLVFLDLYLGITGEAAALQEAADRIRSLVEDGSNATRPLIILMSTRDGPEFAPLARELQARAGLLGCKFRPVNKAEFAVAVPRALHELTSRFEDGEAMSSWLDAWSADIEAARLEFVRGMKLLDLSDLAYLTKYRLEVEGMKLGTYLRLSASSFLQFCIERQEAVGRAEAALERIDFDTMPPAHFLPSSQVPLLRHASSFLADAALDRDPLPPLRPGRSLELGDLIVQKPKKPKRRSAAPPDQPQSTPVWVVISQACDIAQGKADTILLLRGEIQERAWMTDLASSADMTDVFINGERELTISWAKARINAWTLDMADIRLAATGEYARIARFREVEALKLQQLFASNLTRVGTLASPHAAAPVGLRLYAPSTDGAGHRHIMSVDASEKAAAVIQGRVRVRSNSGKPKGEMEKRLVFGREMSDRIAKGIAAYERAPDGAPLTPTVQRQLSSLVTSPERLLVFQGSCKVGATLNVAPNFPMSVAWHTTPFKGNLSGKFVLAVVDPTEAELRSAAEAHIEVRPPRSGGKGARKAANGST